MGHVLSPGDAVVSKMGTAFAPSVLSFEGRVLGGERRKGGGFALKDKDQARESRATGLKGVRKRRVGGGRERKSEQKEETRTKCQIERGRKTPTAAHRERSGRPGCGPRQTGGDWDLPLPKGGWGPGVLFTTHQDRTGAASPGFWLPEMNEIPSSESLGSLPRDGS